MVLRNAMLLIGSILAAGLLVEPADAGGAGDGLASLAGKLKRKSGTKNVDKDTDKKQTRKDKVRKDNDKDKPVGGPKLNQAVVEFCRANIGKKIGGGQCSSVAYYALKAAGAALLLFYS